MHCAKGRPSSISFIPPSVPLHTVEPSSVWKIMECFITSTYISFSVLTAFLPPRVDTHMFLPSRWRIQLTARSIFIENSA